ncbi:uncharacterized protein [Prorops nasuta]|uniref:uncharacterized protein n=1 Tax=Prorops nasuta TaxID=863751 RepID=UPI0034CE4D3C
MWFFDGYKYYIKKKTDKTIYLSCIKHKLLNCKGRGKYVNGKFYLIKTHNHLKLKEANDNLKFYSILKDLCKIPGLDPIKVYASAKERCPDVGRYISYSSCRRRIQKYKMSNNLMSQNNIKVKSLVDFARSLENIKSTCFLEYTYGDEKCKLSFKSIISNSSLKTDAIPIIWVFMNNRNEENYTKVFEYLKDNIPSFNPATVMTDYEKAIGNGLKRNYPHVKICYCYFHYSQTS